MGKCHQPSADKQGSTACPPKPSATDIQDTAVAPSGRDHPVKVDGSGKAESSGQSTEPWPARALELSMTSKSTAARSSMQRYLDPMLSGSGSPEIHYENALTETHLALKQIVLAIDAPRLFDLTLQCFLQQPRHRQANVERWTLQ